jgi:hypothetical protein
MDGKTEEVVPGLTESKKRVYYFSSFSDQKEEVWEPKVLEFDVEQRRNMEGSRTART